jgi:hypothetical protein
VGPRSLNSSGLGNKEILNAPLGRRPLGQEPLEHVPWDLDHTAVLASISDTLSIGDLDLAHAADFQAALADGGVQSWGEATSPANAPSQPGTQPAPTTTQRTTPAPAGAGQVWVNTASKVYHCPGTRWYGKTKQGSYMSEAEARAQGARPDHGKACTS